MAPYFSDRFFNPSSVYQPAREVRRDIETARQAVAQCLGAKPTEVIFTAGATESINLVFHGVLSTPGHVVVSAIEHAAVLETAKLYSHDTARVDKSGRVDLEHLARLIRSDTRLVSIGLVNNEIGTIQPMKEIAALLGRIRQGRQKVRNTTPLWLHSDASQAAGLLPLNVGRLGVDLLTLNAAKIYGPKQTGVLWVKKGIELVPFLRGGGQEKSFRPGGENVPGIVGLARALEIAEETRPTEVKRLQQLRHIFLDSLQVATEFKTLSDPKRGAAHILLLSWPGLDAERILYGLETKGVLAATGAACAARKGQSSHVLQALGLDKPTIGGSLRFSFGRHTTERELVQAGKIIGEVITKEKQRL